MTAPFAGIRSRLELTDENVRAGWAEFLCRYRWDVFATLTYERPVWCDEKIPCVEIPAGATQAAGNPG